MCCAAAGGIARPSQSAETYSAASLQIMSSPLSADERRTKAPEELRGRQRGAIEPCQEGRQGSWPVPRRICPSTSRSQRSVRCSSVRRRKASVTMDAISTRLGAGGSISSSSVAFCLRPPLRGLPSSNPEEIRARRTAFGVEAMRAAPDLRKGFLHNVFSRLFVDKKVPEENPEARSGFSIPGIERVGVAVGDLLPYLPVVEQSDLLPVLSKIDEKSSGRAINLSQVGRRAQQVEQSPSKVRLCQVPSSLP